MYQIRPYYFVPQYNASSILLKIVYYVTSFVSMMLSFGGLVITVFLIINLLKANFSPTTFDYIFFGGSAMAFVWDGICALAAVILMFNNTSELKNMTNYFGISFLIASISDIAGIGLCAMILILGDSPILVGIKTIVIYTLLFLLVHMGVYCTFIITLMKIINELPLNYSRILNLP